MSLRQEWVLDNKSSSRTERASPSSQPSLHDVAGAILSSDLLTANFQPLCDSRDGFIYGYEALARLKTGALQVGIEEIFKSAHLTGKIKKLDEVCWKNAMRLAKIAGIGPGTRLFVNISPMSITDAEADTARLDGIAAQWGLSPSDIVLEIMENVPLTSHGEALRAFSILKKMGYKIAIDDFGSGYAGLQTLSVIRPDFVKIDRSLIFDMDRILLKRRIVESIITACHKCGIKTVAEGLERAEEVETALDLGVELLQGYYISRPAPDLATSPINIPLKSRRASISLASKLRSAADIVLIGDMAIKGATISHTATVMEAFDMFISNQELKSLPVLEDSRICGLLQRTRFLENEILGKYGYGMHLNKHKTVGQLMEQDFFVVEGSTPTDEVSLRIQTRRHECIYDDICVTKNGLYAGAVAVISLLEVMTERTIAMARGANPLTGMPGNEIIRRETDKRLAQRLPFDVCYIDMDNFKPFNDCYGFDVGDKAINALAEVIRNAAAEIDDASSFAGHIGGDDFIVITRPGISGELCERIVKDFAGKSLELHGAEDFERGCYSSVSRKGKDKAFGLLSVSIGIVSARGVEGESYASIASISAEVKKAAKAIEGSAIVKDRRYDVDEGLAGRQTRS